MTRKDYVLIAAALKEARMHSLLIEDYDPTSGGFREGIKACALEIAGALKRENGSFDRKRFLKAAGVEE